MGNIIESTTTVTEVADVDKSAQSSSIDGPNSDLKQMSFTDLVDKANSNKDFIDEAGLEFSRRSHQTVKIHGLRCAKGGFHLTHKVKPNCIEVYNRDLCLKILRNFGNFITKLVIDFDGLNSTDVFNKFILNEVNEFSANSLIELELLNCRSVSFEELIHPFPEVQCVCFKNCSLESQDDGWLRLFPAVNRLELLGNKVTYKQCIERGCANLQHLAVHLNNGGFSQDNLLAALCFNQQLTSLHLVAHVDSTLLHSISQVTPFLQCLQLNILSYDFSVDETAHFNNVERLVVILDGGPFINLPIWFDRLTELEVTVNDGLHDKFSEFISRNEKLVKLTIIAPSWNQIELIDDDMNTIATKLQCLTDFTLRRCTISLAATVNFMRNVKMLRDFRFSVTKKLEDEQMQQLQIDNTWKLTTDGNSYKCERK